MLFFMLSKQKKLSLDTCDYSPSCEGMERILVISKNSEICRNRFPTCSLPLFPSHSTRSPSKPCHSVKLFKSVRMD